MHKMENRNLIINGTGSDIDGTVHSITEKTTLGELLTILGPVEKEDKTPTPKKLREEAGAPIAMEERCTVYANGYAVYDNGSGRTVVWVPACTSFTYYFDKMKDSEKGGDIKETFELPEGLLESQPWPIAITLIGDHRVENLALQRKADRKQNKTLIRGDKEEGEAMDEMEEQVDSLTKEYIWRESQIGEDPETIYIRKETCREMLESMTDKQREVFILYYYYGYRQQEIADMMGITQAGVKHHLDGAIKKSKKVFC